MATLQYFGWMERGVVGTDEAASSASLLDAVEAAVSAIRVRIAGVDNAAEKDIEQGAGEGSEGSEAGEVGHRQGQQDGVERAAVARDGSMDGFSGGFERNGAENMMHVLAMSCIEQQLQQQASNPSLMPYLATISHCLLLSLDNLPPSTTISSSSNRQLPAGFPQLPSSHWLFSRLLDLSLSPLEPESKQLPLLWLPAFVASAHCTLLLPLLLHRLLLLLSTSSSQSPSSSSPSTLSTAALAGPLPPPLPSPPSAAAAATGHDDDGHFWIQASPLLLLLQFIATRYPAHFAAIVSPSRETLSTPTPQFSSLLPPSLLLFLLTLSPTILSALLPHFSPSHFSSLLLASLDPSMLSSPSSLHLPSPPSSLVPSPSSLSPPTNSPPPLWLASLIYSRSSLLLPVGQPLLHHLLLALSPEPSLPPPPFHPIPSLLPSSIASYLLRLLCSSFAATLVLGPSSRANSLLTQMVAAVPGKSSILLLTAGVWRGRAHKVEMEQSGEGVSRQELGVEEGEVVECLVQFFLLLLTQQSDTPGLAALLLPLLVASGNEALLLLKRGREGRGRGQVGDGGVERKQEDEDGVGSVSRKVQTSTRSPCPFPLTALFRLSFTTLSFSSPSFGAAFAAAVAAEMRRSQHDEMRHLLAALSILFLPSPSLPSPLNSFPLTPSSLSALGCPLLTCCISPLLLLLLPERGEGKALAVQTAERTEDGGDESSRRGVQQLVLQLLEQLLGCQGSQESNEKLLLGIFFHRLLHSIPWPHERRLMRLTAAAFSYSPLLFCQLLHFSLDFASLLPLTADAPLSDVDVFRLLGVKWEGGMEWGGMMDGSEGGGGQGRQQKKKRKAISGMLDQNRKLMRAALPSLAASYQHQPAAIPQRSQRNYSDRVDEVSWKLRIVIEDAFAAVQERGRGGEESERAVQVLSEAIFERVHFCHLTDISLTAAEYEEVLPRSVRDPRHVAIVSRLRNTPLLLHLLELLCSIGWSPHLSRLSPILSPLLADVISASYAAGQAAGSKQSATTARGLTPPMLPTALRLIRLLAAANLLPPQLATCSELASTFHPADVTLLLMLTWRCMHFALPLSTPPLWLPLHPSPSDDSSASKHDNTAAVCPIQWQTLLFDIFRRNMAMLGPQFRRAAIF